MMALRAAEVVQTAEEVRANIDLELEQRVKGSCGRISENAHIFANEPSLACYRLQEHARRSLGPAVERRLQLAEARHQLWGKCYDLDYSVAALRGFTRSREHLLNLQELLKNAIFMRQQLAHREARLANINKVQKPTRLQRLSGSLELPDGPPAAPSRSPSVGEGRPHPMRSSSSSPRPTRALSWAHPATPQK